MILQLFKFACIGALNTAVDFVILNFLTISLGITGGLKLGLINVVGVVIAILQSYYWNRVWAFAVDSGVSLLKQFIRLVLVGGLGFLTFVAVLVGVNLGMSAAFYGFLLFAYVVVQAVFIISFHFPKIQQGDAAEFEKFVLVSLIGVGVNSIVLVVGVLVLTKLDLGLAEPLIKNLAKFAAVFVSLAWNFVGYKFFVFKR